MHIPFLKEDFGFDFKIKAFNDLQISAVRIIDNYGSFIPIPFLVWDKIINQKLHLVVMEKYKEIHQQIAYEQAILIYCREYAHTYICLN